MNFLTNWKIVAAITFVLTLASSFGAYKVRMMFVEAAHVRELAKVQSQMIDTCNKAQAITQEVSNEYQKELARANGRINSFMRMQPQCIAIIKAKPASGRDAAR